jgi:hypothetical protein
MQHARHKITFCWVMWYAISTILVLRMVYKSKVTVCPHLIQYEDYRMSNPKYVYAHKLTYHELSFKMPPTTPTHQNEWHY